MKRYGYKQILANANEITIRFYDWYELNNGFRVFLNGEMVGYTTFKDMCKLDYEMDKTAHIFFNFKKETQN